MMALRGPSKYWSMLSGLNPIKNASGEARKSEESSFMRIYLLSNERIFSEESNSDATKIPIPMTAINRKKVV